MVESPQQPSILNMLRSRVAGDLENERINRLAEFGAGMAASASPNFFTMLAGGTRAQAEGERSRMDRLRQLAETERQQRMTDIEEQRRRDEASDRKAQLRLDERRLAQGDRPQYEVVGTDARGNAIVIDKRDLTRRQTLEGVTPLQVASLNARIDAGREGRATQAGVRAVADAQRNNPGRGFTAQELDTIYQDAFRRSMNTPEGAASPPAPAARIDARGNPIR